MKGKTIVFSNNLLFKKKQHLVKLVIFTFVLLLCVSYNTDVPRPLTNDLWVFLFQMIDAECVK